MAVKSMRLNAALVKPGRSTPGRHFVVIPEAHTLEDVLRHDYWSNCGMLFRPFDRVEFVSERFEFEGELRVTSQGENTVRFYPIRVDDRRAPDEAQTEDGVEVTWGGPAHKFRVMDSGRVASGAGGLLIGFGTREDASEAAEAYRARR